MKMAHDNSKRGFTLIELMVAMALGLVLLAAMGSLFKTGMDSTMLVTQRSETQQNMRAAVDLMAKDLSMAGAGLPSGGISLPSGVGNNGLSKFGCDQTGTCHVPTNTYPAGNQMYGIIPGYKNGVEANAVIPAAPSPVFSDSVTVVYVDYNFPISEYYACFPTGANGGKVNLTVNPGFAPAPPLPNAAGGIQVGDLIMLSGGSLTGVGEVTTLDTASLTFANLDSLNINQSGAAAGNLKAIQNAVGSCTAVAGANNVSIYRLYAITYYLNVPAVAGQTPRLMRQVNGLTPVPVADDIINLQFAFDSYTTGGGVDANQADPLGKGESPNNIQKVNVLVLGQSIVTGANKAQNMYLATDVAARNMAFRNRYQ